MQVRTTPLKEQIAQMKRMGRMLIPYTSPRVDYRTEADVMPLKMRELTIDGYAVHVSYSVAEGDDAYTEIVQIMATTSPFLPHNVVCNIGKLFLGSEHLSLISFVKADRRVYCWIKKYIHEQEPLEPLLGRIERYEGWSYQMLPPESEGFF